MTATSRIGAFLPTVLVALYVLACGHTINAAVTTWNGSQTPNLSWSQPGNWSHGVPGTSDTAALGNTGSHGGSVGTVTNIVDASRTIAAMVFSNAYGRYDTPQNTHATDLSGNSVTITGSLVVNKNLGVSGVNGGSYTQTTTVVQMAGGTLSVGTGAAGDELLVGAVDNGLGAIFHTMPRGELDLSGLTALNVNVANIYLGVNLHSDSQNNVQASGQLVLSPDNTITATRFWVAESPNPGQGTVTSSVQFGMGNTLNVDDLLIGGRKSHGIASIVSGGTLNVAGKTSGSANLRIADNNSGTSISGSGTLDLSGGTFNATLNQLIIGRRSTGGGTGVGALIMDAGTVSVTSVQLGIGGTTASGTFTMNGGTFNVANGVTSGPGASAINVNGGTVTVSGGLQVDSLAVGMEGRTGTVTATGAVHIGASTASHTLDVGRRTTAVTGTTVGTLNLTGAGSVTMSLKSLRLGTNSTAHVDGQGSSRGTLLLSASNVIDAESIIVSDALGTGNAGQQSKITLGADNTIRSDSILVAGRKGEGLIDIVSGGVLNLTGLNGPRTDIRVGYNDMGGQTTGVGSVGHFDLRGASAGTSLLVGEMVLGYAATGGTTGGAGGTFSMDAGIVDVTTLTLADHVSGASPTATFNLEGGALIAGTVRKGTGTANFSFTGGSLQVGNFLFDLVQNGSGTGFTPGGSSVGTSFIDGNYTLASGTWDMQFDGSNSMSDLVQVSGALNLSGATALDVGLLSAVTPGQTFVIASYGSLTGQFSVENLSALPNGSFVDYAYLGNSIAVTIIPEPSSLLLLACLLAGWFSGFRPRHRAG
ncbi:MAG: hypothetical protein U1E05_27040 [Patescibacteria group bacterium]|nr:hypothetical protein [Patescibacteria group bacterium]